MIYKGIPICCPQCKGELTETAVSRWTCQTCGREYPIIAGIPDLRVFSDPYIDIAADREKGIKLAGQLEQLSFPDLVTYYYQNTQVVPPQHAQLYTRGLLAAAARAEAALNAWTAVSGSPHGRSLLEIGCGTAPLLVAAASQFERVVGIDIAFRWLMVGQKRLMAAGLDIPLICACAEALPFPDGQFDTVASESTLEHLQDQEQALAECHRVLGENGRFYASIPNKYSLGPDPHVGILAGGYLPDSLIATIVTRQGGIPPKRRLLGKSSLSRLLRDAGFTDAHIFLPDIPAGQRAHFSGLMGTMIDTYHLVKRAPGSRHLLEWIGPLLYVVARRRDEGDDL